MGKRSLRRLIERRLVGFTFAQAFRNFSAHSDFRSITTSERFALQYGQRDQNNRNCKSLHRLRLVMLCRWPGPMRRQPITLNTNDARVFPESPEGIDENDVTHAQLAMVSYE